jgi:predicted transcriptional regulator
MSNWNEELTQEEKAKIETGSNQAENNEFINHEEVIDIFLKWDRSF